MLQKAVNFIYNFDIIGPSPKLYIFNKETYQTVFSLILSMLIIISSFIYILYSIADYIQNNRPNVVYSKSNDNNEERKINLKEVLLMFQILDYNTMKKVNESIAYFESINVAIYDNAKVNFYPIEVKACKPGENLNVKYENYLKHKFDELAEVQVQEGKNIKDFYCINTQNIDLSLFYEPNVGYSYLDLNLILKNQSLYRPEDISIMFIYENNLINHDNKKSPISVGISSQTLQTFSSEEFYITNFNFQYLKYETDDGLFFEDLKYLNGISLFDMTQSINNQEKYNLENDLVKYNSSKFGTFRFALNKSNYDFYRRSYKKIQTLLAEIMSIVSLLFEIGRQILSFLNEKKMSIDIIRTLFNIEKKSRKYKYNDDRIKIVPEKMNNSFKLSEKNNIYIKTSISMNEEPENKTEVILKKINVFHIIKNFFCCNNPKGKLISLCHEIIQNDMCVETILERFYNLGRIYKSITDIEKYDLGLNKDSRFREINSIIYDIKLSKNESRKKESDT